MLRMLDHRLLNSRHTYSILLRCSYTIVHRCCTFSPNNLIKPRTDRSSPSPLVVVSNALRSVVKPLLPPMSDSAIAGHMSNFMKQQQPPALPSHLLRVGGPFSARAALLPLLQKPTLPLPAAGSSLYNYYITNFNFNAAAATARRQFSTSPASSTDPLPQGSEGGFQSSGNTQKLDVMDDMESQMSKNRPFWDFLILALQALFFFYMFFSSVAGVEIHTSPLTNRKIIVCDQKMFGKEKVDKRFRESITGSETLPHTHHYSCKVRSMLEEILSNMDKVIKQLPRSLNGIKWEIVASKVPGNSAESYCNGKIIINPSSLQRLYTDGKLAFIIGHEVAHIVAEHGDEYFANIRLGSGLIAFIQALRIVYFPQPFTFLGIPLFPLFAILCLFIRHLCLSQRHELEADYIGMLLSASAGYDPREAHKYFTEVTRDSSRIPSFLRVHPPDEKRAEALLQNKMLERALAIYKNS